MSTSFFNFTEYHFFYAIAIENIFNIKKAQSPKNKIPYDVIQKEGKQPKIYMKL